MFYDVGSMQEVVERLENVQDSQAFQAAMGDLRAYMQNLGMDLQYLSELERRAYYLQNEYSDRDTKAKMLEAKNRVIEYIDEIMANNKKDKQQLDVLENYYLFWKIFWSGHLIRKVESKKNSWSV